MSDPRTIGRGWPGGFRPRLRARKAGGGLATLIVGAGSAARTLMRDLRNCPDYGLRPVGLLDDDPGIRSVFGTPVLGTLADLRRVVREHQIHAVIIAIPSLPPAALSGLIRAAADTGVHVRYLPSFLAAVERVARAADMRAVSYRDLLGRAERRILEPAVQAMLTGARVLVTGAGGSIGQELCRQIRSHEPASLHMLDHDETNVHTLQLELSGRALLDSPEIVIADIRDETRIRQVFRATRPDVVFHAAAHKHLPLLERHPGEGVKTNVLGTQNVVRAAADNGAQRLLLISTDKAAEPRSILGATKRLAEMIVQASAGAEMRACSVRFGNVLGSRGSLLAVVRSQIERGEPVTVTDPDVTRFFMTVEEAVGLVLSAAPMGEFGETFVLDMGEPVRIVDLVRRYASQLRVPDVQIHFTGLRPGEKLHETLFGALEERLPTVNPAIWATRHGRLPGDFASSLDLLYAAAADGDDEKVRILLGDLVPEYQPAAGAVAEAALASPYPDEF
ncbi:MAG TPA: nucleoside-diphosphate sugar epimerase/dehydratase [Streptosporangiaceae bacterium]|jgi:FlaA1/EpsC-like NDP-sugar epimerase|nr:nucleoside-diphosphate sugar epimerase/dehydratase [Streptosporangiaceae bacterium]